MEINEEVLKKVKSFIIKKNIKDLNNEAHIQSKDIYEADYDLAVNDKISDLVFVVSVKTTYRSGRIEDKKYGIYAFDKKTGEQVKNFEESDKCYFNFFNDLKIIENIL